MHFAAQNYLMCNLYSRGIMSSRGKFCGAKLGTPRDSKFSRKFLRRTPIPFAALIFMPRNLEIRAIINFRENFCAASCCFLMRKTLLHVTWFTGNFASHPKAFRSAKIFCAKFETLRCHEFSREVLRRETTFVFSCFEAWERNSREETFGFLLAKIFAASAEFCGISSDIWCDKIVFVAQDFTGSHETPMLFWICHTKKK